MPIFTPQQIIHLPHFVPSALQQVIVLDDGVIKGGTIDRGPRCDITSQGSSSIWSWVWSHAVPHSLKTDFSSE